MRHLTDLRTLTLLIAVAREGSVTRAAEVLHLTQPAISLQLKRLADATGVCLFQRTPKGLDLTRDGAALVAKAEQVLCAMAEFNHSARCLTGRVQGKIRIGTIIDPYFTRLGAFLRELVDTAPGLETQLVHGVSGEVVQRILRDELDVGYFLGEFDAIAGVDEPQRQIFCQQQLAEFAYKVIGPPGWEKRIQNLDWHDLARLPWIGTPATSVHNRLLGRIFAERGLEQNKVAMVDQELSMLAMVRSGVGLSLCRDSLALFERQAHGVVVSERVEVPTSLSFVCLSARRADPIVGCAFDAISGVWPKGAGFAWAEEVAT